MDDRHDAQETAHPADTDQATTHVAGLIRRLFRGAHQSAVPEEAALPKSQDTAVTVDVGTAEALRHLAAGAADRREQKGEAGQERRDLDDKQRIKVLLQTHLADQMWNELMSHVQPAAERGDREFQLLRFPSDLCTDGGRKIRIGEEGWEETLQGEAAELATRCKAELQPKGFGMMARMVDYSGGMPGDIGLFLTWQG